MRALWRGERVNGASLLAWPGTEAGRRHFGAWRSAKTSRAAVNSTGGSPRGSTAWDDLETGMKTFRAHGGKRAILTNVHTDIHTDIRENERRFIVARRHDLAVMHASRSARAPATAGSDRLRRRHAHLPDRSERHLGSVRALAP
jgi:hypothetical protein